MISPSIFFIIILLSLLFQNITGQFYPNLIIIKKLYRDQLPFICNLQKRVDIAEIYFFLNKKNAKVIFVILETNICEKNFGVSC